MKFDDESVVDAAANIGTPGQPEFATAGKAESPTSVVTIDDPVTVVTDPRSSKYRVPLAGTWITVPAAADVCTGTARVTGLTVQPLAQRLLAMI
jgi:hypothetical protein